MTSNCSKYWIKAKQTNNRVYGQFTISSLYITISNMEQWEENTEDMMPKVMKISYNNKETHRLNFPSSAKYKIYRLIAPAVKQHQRGKLSWFSCFLGEWFSFAWDHSYSAHTGTKLALRIKQRVSRKHHQ